MAHLTKILVSSCLTGLPVRYDGNGKATDRSILDRWRNEGRLVCICPELAAGFPVPRPPAEIRNGGGQQVLLRSARVFENTGKDVTDLYLSGADHVLRLARKYSISVALLADGSPSCGSSYIYSGDFSGRIKNGKGVTAALLEANGIVVFPHTRIPEADLYLNSQDRS